MIDSAERVIEQRTNNNRAKAVTVLLGIALFLTVSFVISFALGDDTSFDMPLLIASYGISGLILGFTWPDMSWRLGLWLCLIWPPILLFMLFLSAEQPSNWRRELPDLFGYLLILTAACLGAGLGAFIRRRRS